MKEKLLDIICCPGCKGNLTLSKAGKDNGQIKTGILKCSGCGEEYPIINYIPRFIKTDKYVSSFSFEWTVHKKTQLDSMTGNTESRDSFITKTGTEELGELKDKIILDVGCGMGRYMEIVQPYAMEVVGVDLSYAVDSAYDNLKQFKNIHIIQADIFHLPFKGGVFNFIYSIGVLHHTPDTKQAFMKLPPLLKKGGEVAIWVYSKCHHEHLPDFHYRRITTKLPKKLLYALGYLDIPFYYLKKIPILRSFLSIYMHTSNHPNWRWRVLDTFDWYSAKYLFTHTCYEVIGWFKEAELKEIELLEFPVSVRGRKL